MLSKTSNFFSLFFILFCFSCNKQEAILPQVVAEEYEKHADDKNEKEELPKCFTFAEVGRVWTYANVNIREGTNDTILSNETKVSIESKNGDGSFNVEGDFPGLTSKGILFVEGHVIKRIESPILKCGDEKGQIYSWGTDYYDTYSHSVEGFDTIEYQGKNIKCTVISLDRHPQGEYYKLIWINNSYGLVKYSFEGWMYGSQNYVQLISTNFD